MQRQDEKALNVSANEKTINGNLLTDEEHPFTDKSPDISGELLHVRDVNSKDIFKNNVLTSQFLKDYSSKRIREQ